jgi:hypothetical protein
MTWLARTTASALLALAASSSTQAQAPTGSLDAGARNVAVEAAAKALRERYVFPDVGERAAAAIEGALSAGRYDQLTELHAFADTLTGDLQNVAHDKHLSVYAAGPPPAPAAGAASRPRLHPEYGILRADRLAGNVGYIEFLGFPPPEAFNVGADRAMAALAGARALIIDGRRNTGGDPASVAHLVSFFLDAATPVHVNSFVWPNPGTATYRTEEFWSAPTPVSFAGKPVFVLSSPQTFSGGEEFAYDMQVLKLGVIVGDTTGGGANPGGTVPLGPALALFVPGGRAENPITKSNWEGVGVKPDIAAPAADALKVTLEKLGLKPASSDIDALSEARVFTPRSTPLPGTEAAIRRLISELQRGEPNYDLMSDGLARDTREQLPALHDTLAKLGAIESMTFVEVDDGADVYDVKLANGVVRSGIALAPDGKAIRAWVTPQATPVVSR